MADDDKKTPTSVAPPPPAKRSKKPMAIVGGVVAAAALVFGGVALAGRGKETTDDAQVDADVVNVSTRVGGQVLKVALVDNAPVKKGDLILEIDPADLAAKKKQAEAELDAARAQAAVADAQIRITDATSKGGLSGARAALAGTAAASRSADAQIEAARAAQRKAQSEAERLKADADRTQALFNVGGAPKVSVDNANSALASALASQSLAEANLSAALEAKKSAESRIGEAEARVQQTGPVDAQSAVAAAQADLAHARVKSAEAMLDAATLQLSYAQVRAPVDGTLSKIAVHEGQNVSPGMLVVAVVPAQTFVVANFKETQVTDIHVGQRAEIVIDGMGGKKIEGKVAGVSPATGARFALLPPDNASGNFVKVVQRVPVRIDWASPLAAPLAAGRSAEVTVFTDGGR